MGRSGKAEHLAPANRDLVPDAPEPRVLNPKPHVSYSQLGTYMRCSMQYYFAYILRLRQRPSLPLAMGSGGHTALEYNGRHKMKAGTDLPVNDMLDLASTFIDGELQDLSQEAANNNERGKAKDITLQSLKYYQLNEAPLVTPAGVEVPFDLDLNDPTEENVEPIRIVNGKIDLITTTTDVDDYKFTGQAKSRGEVNLTPQLTLYQKVFHTLTGKYAYSSSLRMFVPPTKDRPSGYLAIKRDPALMTPAAQESRFKRLRFQFQQAEKAIRTGIYMPTDNPIVCSWCGYRDRCQSSLVDDFQAATIRGE